MACLLSALQQRKRRKAREPNGNQWKLIGVSVAAVDGLRPITHNFISFTHRKRNEFVCSWAAPFHFFLNLFIHLISLSFHQIQSQMERKEELGWAGLFLCGALWPRAAHNPPQINQPTLPFNPAEAAAINKWFHFISSFFWFAFRWGPRAPFFSSFRKLMNERNGPPLNHQLSIWFHFHKIKWSWLMELLL